MVRSRPLLQFFAGDFAVPENLGQETAADGFAAVNGNDRAASVDVTEKVVAPLDSDHLKTEMPKCPDELHPSWRGEAAHAITATRWTPMN